MPQSDPMGGGDMEQRLVRRKGGSRGGRVVRALLLGVVLALVPALPGHAIELVIEIGDVLVVVDADATFDDDSSVITADVFIVAGGTSVGVSVDHVCRGGASTTSVGVVLGGGSGASSAGAPEQAAPGSCLPPDPLPDPPLDPVPDPPPDPLPDPVPDPLGEPQPAAIGEPADVPTATGGPEALEPGPPEPAPAAVDPGPAAPPAESGTPPVVSPAPAPAAPGVADVADVVLLAAAVTAPVPEGRAVPVVEPPAPPPLAPEPAEPPPSPSPGSPVAAPAPPAPTVAGGARTLHAFTREGFASGRPGVGLTVVGTGFPPRAERRPTRALAAPSSPAQDAEGCATVYLFFGDARIGTATPDTTGGFRRTGLSVPGGTGPGRHPVTASCRSSGVPVLATTPFAVTDASLHRTAFATSLHRTDHVRFDLGSVLLAALGAIALLVLIAFPAELFNTTLEEHYDEVRGWFRLPPRSASAGTGVPNVVLFVTFLALSGPLWFAMQRSSKLDLATALGALGLSLATAVVVLGSDLPTFAHLRRRYREGAYVVALPGTLLVAVGCVLLSRAVRFEPGYFYGLVGGLAFSRRLRRDTTGRLAATSAALLIALSFLAWLALTPVARIADRPDAGAWPILAEGFLGGVFWVALDSLVIALLPLRLLTGSKVVGWSRAAWAALYVLAFTAFVLILLRPGTGYVSDTTRSPTTVVVGLFVGFALLSFGFWGYFRFRAPRPEDQAAAPA